MKYSSFLLTLFTLSLQSVFGAKWNYAGDQVVGTILMDVSFADENNGLTAGGDNGGGALILRTTDGGKTWSNAVFDTAMMFLGVARNDDTAVSMGLFTTQYSTDEGETFNSANKGEKCLVSQNLEYSVKDDFFASVGSFLKGQVATSQDGKKWNEFDISSVYEEGALPRYGAFPDKDTWYVTCGTWPMDNSTEPIDPSVLLTSRLNVDFTSSSLTNNLNVLRPQSIQYKNDNNLEMLSTKKQRNLRKGLKDTTGSYMSQVLKTSDGGQTWKSVYLNNDENYPNGIHCYDANTCAFVAEAEQDSSKPGVSIYYTNDGGDNWKEVMYLPTASASLFQVRMLSQTEFHAVGGNLDNRNFGSLHFHTTDAGENFEQIDPLKGTYLNSIQFINEDLAYGSAFTKSGQSTIMKYSN